MMSIGVTVLVVAVAWALLYFRASLVLWSTVVFAALALWTLQDDAARIAQIVFWLAFVAVFLPLNVNPLRRRLISDRLFRLFRRILPPMSGTEREALEAGSVWWDGELFSGAPHWKTLLKYPQPQLSDEERAFLEGPVEELCALLDDWEITHERNDLSPEVWRFIKDKGFFGMIIPKRYGGLEFSALAHSAVVMKVASRSITASVTVMVPNSLGPAELLMHYGTDVQKDHYLPRLACGEEVPCFALTGPGAGSDAASMPDKGVVCKGEFKGQRDVLGIRLNWDKRYITLGPVATVLGLAFKLYDPEHLLGETESLGITLALIPADAPGITIGRRHLPLNIPFQNGPTQGKDVFIPMDQVIGGAEHIGQGWRMLMETLAAGRSISLPALSTGAGKLASRATGAYARIRRQFKLPIGRFEGIEEPLARIAAHTYQMDAVRTMTAGAVDLGEKPAVLSAIAKYNLTEKMRQALNDAMDIQGGSAICMGPRNFLARAYQGIPISITVEGANILTRSLIVFGQGAVRCHPFVLKEINAVNDLDTRKGGRNFDRALFGHIGFTLSNLARTLFLGLSGARLVRAPVRNPARSYYRQFTRMSAAFALAADMSMLVLGGALKRKEKLSGRLADVVSNLYIGSACLKRFQDQGCPAEDLPLLQWSCDQALHNIQRGLIGVLRNFPIRPVAILLRLFIFPFGQTYREPSDALGRRVAGLLLEPSAARDRLTDGIYVPEDTAQSVGRIEDALAKVIAAEPVEKALQHAVHDGSLKGGGGLLERAVEAGIVTAEQADAVRAAAVARNDVVAVDDFPPTLGEPGRVAGERHAAEPEPVHGVGG